MRTLRRAAMTTLLLLAGSAPAQVEDTAGLFTPDAIKEADQRIARIRDELGKNLVIFTVTEVPEHRKIGLNLEGDAGHRKELFQTWAKERIADKKLQGIHILVCEKPRHIEITVTPDTEALFGEWYQKHLHKRLVWKIQPDNPDQHILQSGINLVSRMVRRSDRAEDGLQEAVVYVGDKLEANRPIDQTRWYAGLGAMAIMMLGWLVLSVARTKLRKATASDAGVHDAEESGRSVAVLGGGIGAVCGQWVADRLFGRHPPPALPDPQRLVLSDLPDGEPAEPPDPEREP